MKKKLLLSTAVFLFTIVTVSAQPGVKRILLEEFSTAPCGFCPEGDLYAQQIIDNYPQVIWMTHHAGFGTDSMTIPESITIANAFTTFAPGACIDRGDYPIPIYTTPPFIAISRQKWDSVVVSHLNDPPVVDVFMANSYDSVTRKLNSTVTINFLSTPASGDLRLNLFLMEDSIVGFGNGYDQTNYFNGTAGHPFYNMGNPIVGYVHHHVVRKAVTGTWGITGVIPSAPVAGSSYTHVFTNINISPSWKDDDVTVIAFVSYYNNDAHLRKVINSNITDLKNITTGVSLNVQQGVDVYPNPVSDYLNIEFDNAAANTIQIINSHGQVVKNVSVMGRLKHILSVTDLPNGIYSYKINTAKNSCRGKVVIVH